MSHRDISLNKRIIQANHRLKELCYEFYRGELSESDFRAERADILKFIDETGKTHTLHSMPIIKNNDITGTFPVIS